MSSQPSAAPPLTRRWLLLLHQLPSSPSNLRVRTWRRLQALGAIAVRQAAYVLPDSPAAREDFEWLKAEIIGAGGEASVFSAATVDAWTDDELIEQFRRSRQEAYAALARELEQVSKRSARKRARPPAARQIQTFRQRLADLERIDFFGAPGRDRAAALVDQLEEQAARTRPRPPAPAAAGRDPGAYRGRLWVTRPRPAVDRMSSAWLIRRFIDPEARFDFVPDRTAAPRDAVPFDMFDVEFTHQADRCTFETLCQVFGIADPAVARIATIVHDLDLRDSRFGAPEAQTVGLVIEGLQRAHADDGELLAQGMALFEALYLAFAQPGPPGPRFAGGGTRRRSRARTRNREP
jgi:hypothetical protein